jgi:hypothetical protein
MNINELMKQEEDINIYSEMQLSDHSNDEKNLTWLRQTNYKLFDLISGLTPQNTLERKKIVVDYKVPINCISKVFLAGSGTGFRQRDDFGQEFVKPSNFSHLKKVEFVLTKASKATCYIWIYEYDDSGKFIQAYRSIFCYNSTSKIMKK